MLSCKLPHRHFNQQHVNQQNNLMGYKPCPELEVKLRGVDNMTSCTDIYIYIWQCPLSSPAYLTHQSNFFVAQAH